MPDDNTYGLSRRKTLLGLSTIGVAAAGAGLGTSALFSDDESFTNNSIQAGELDLVIDYTATVTQDGVETGGTPEDGSPNTGTIQGGESGQYQIADLKPGDSGFLAFCPKIIDNPGWLFVGSAEGVTDYENGQTEPEGDVDPSGGGSLGSPNDGAGAGELSEAIQVDVEYCEPNTDDPQGPGDYNTIREFNNPDDYTLADLFKELESGFLLDGDAAGARGTQEYPSSPDQDTQNGPCLCITWELPASVGNDVQSDAVEFDITFAARQWRNNPNPENPFVDTTVGEGSNFDFDTSAGDTLQGAINSASSGDVISVAEQSGSYDSINISDSLSIVAAPLDSPLIEGSGDTSGNTIGTNGKGITLDANSVLLRGLSIEKFNNGLRVSGGASVEGLYVIGCGFDNNDDGWYIANPNSGSSGTFDDVLVWNTTFNNNLLKGLYVEKLSNARFYDIEVKDSGTIDPSASPRNTGVGITNGIDLNLKFDDYENISIKNSTFDNSGLDPGIGDELHGALVVKARGTGSDTAYGPPGATVDNVVVENTTFEFDQSTQNNSPGGTKAIQTGEPGKNLEEPTPGDDNDGDGDDDITITGNTYTNVDIQLNDLTQ